MISRAWGMVLLVALAALVPTPQQGHAQDMEVQLWMAAGAGDMTKVEKLLDAGVNPNCGQGRPLSSAAFGASQKTLEVMELLLEKGADPNLPDDMGRTPLMKLAMQPPYGKGVVEEMIRLLLKTGADVNIRSKDGKTALQLAFEYHAPKPVVDLLTQAQKRSRPR